MTDNTKLTLSKEAIDILSKVTTATLTTLLLKKGLRNVWLRNTKPIRSGQPRLVGRAFTLLSQFQPIDAFVVSLSGPSQQGLQMRA